MAAGKAIEDTVQTAAGEPVNAASAIPAECPAADVSVVICSYDSDRWEYLVRAVESVTMHQTVQPLQTIVVVDHNEGLLTRVRRELPGVLSVANTRTRGASGARNSGAGLARGTVIAFLDDDARADTHWVEALLAAVANPEVAGVGGNIQPEWAGPRPRWFPEQFDWVVGATYRGHPESTATVRNVWSCNMAVHRSLFEVVGGFREGFGKLGSQSRPEDTELCIRITQHTGRRWIYEPRAIVHHSVPSERATPRYFARRCFAEGRGKTALARVVGSGEALGTELSHAWQLPKDAWAELRAVGEWRAGAVERCIAIGGGLALSGAGLLLERLSPSNLGYEKLS